MTQKNRWEFFRTLEDVGLQRRLSWKYHSQVLFNHHPLLRSEVRCGA